MLRRADPQGRPFSLYAVLQAFHLWPIQVNESFQMLSLDDIRHLDAAEGWLERGQYANCFDELERIECNERKDGRVLAVRWKLYNQSGHHLSAANLAAGIQWHFPNEITGYVWHAASLTKPGCTQEAYDTFDAIAGKFDSPGAVPCVLRETSINHQISGY